MPTVRIPTPLRSYTGGQSEVQAHGNTVAEVMDNFLGQYPDLRPHLYNGNGELRAFVNLFLNEENVRDLQGGETALQENDRLVLIPSIAGGRYKRIAYVTQFNSF
ncbi:MAG TPA: MoaD/ThiS family protein [Anaerolineales bacterium]|nr:MoaD/ThiS family protein [Anaerolineales bacterium]